MRTSEIKMNLKVGQSSFRWPALYDAILSKISKITGESKNEILLRFIEGSPELKADCDFRRFIVDISMEVLHLFILEQCGDYYNGPSSALQAKKYYCGNLTSVEKEKLELLNQEKMPIDIFEACVHYTINIYQSLISTSIPALVQDEIYTYIMTRYIKENTTYIDLTKLKDDEAINNHDFSELDALYSKIMA